MGRNRIAALGFMMLGLAGGEIYHNVMKGRKRKEMSDMCSCSLRPPACGAVFGSHGSRHLRPVDRHLDPASIVSEKS
jgi:hypothetical protein